MDLRLVQNSAMCLAILLDPQWAERSVKSWG